MAARVDQDNVHLFTRSGLDWTAKYPATAAALAKLTVTSAYLDGELCGVRPDGVTSFALMQEASDAGLGGMVYYAFDLLELGRDALVAVDLNRSCGRCEWCLEGHRNLCPNVEFIGAPPFDGAMTKHLYSEIADCGVARYDGRPGSRDARAA
jgi:hypothetical protein